MQIYGGADYGAAERRRTDGKRHAKGPDGRGAERHKIHAEMRRVAREMPRPVVLADPLIFVTKGGAFTCPASCECVPNMVCPAYKARAA